MEGTARLNKREVINLSCSCDNGSNCFLDLDAKKYPFGLGSKNNALKHFVSISVGDIPFGSTFIVKQLQELKMPKVCFTTTVSALSRVVGTSSVTAIAIITTTMASVAVTATISTIARV
ncbi:hypothetical protein K7432_016515, partial [Basidiobolus ranarum]